MKKIMLVLFIILTSLGCGNKKVVINESSFNNTMNNNKFSIMDISKDVKDGDYVKKNLLGISEDLATQFNYIEFKNNDDASLYYENFIDIMIDSVEEEYKDNGKEVIENGYLKYSLKTSNYRKIVYINNIVVFGSTSLNNADNLDNIFDEIFQ